MRDKSSGSDIASEMKKMAERVESLTIENKILRESLKNSESIFKAVIEKMPLSIAAIGRDGRILFCNSIFAEGASYATAQAEVVPRALVGVEISSILDAEMSQHVKNSLTHSCDVLGQNFTDKVGRRRSVSLFSIKRGDMCVAVFRDMHDTELLKEEIQDRVRAVIDRNMSMIQNIGSLLGEETSETTRILNSVIKSL